MTNDERRAQVAARYEFSSTLEQLRPADADPVVSPVTVAILKPILGIALLAVLIFASAFAFFTAPPRKMDPQSDAFYSAQQFVAAKLKAPASAKFCQLQEASIAKDGANTVVSGYVDSANAFGAILRSSWTVSLNADGSLATVSVR